MRKATKIHVLLGVLLAVCGAAFAVSRYEEKQEQIKSSGDVILEIPADSVTAVSWTNESGSYSFTRGESSWSYDADPSFPTDGDKITALLEQFESFSAAFTIEDVEDFSQYGLDEPVCTITVTTEEESRTIELGDYSTMDEQRYISIGDGKVYLALHDPLDEFGAEYEELILNDTVPEFDIADRVELAGSESYTFVRDEDGSSICADDIYFTEDGRPLDTDNVDTLLDAIQTLSLTDFASYCVTDEELSTFGMDEPEQTISLEYSCTDDDGNAESTGSVMLSVSRNPEELEAYNEAVENEEEDLPNVTCYARVDDSQIIYKITLSEYEQLTAVSYNTLRHQRMFTGDFDTALSVDITLDGETCTFTCVPSEESSDSEDGGEEGTWTYRDEEFDIYDFKTALRAVKATEFTDEPPTGEQEISLTVHLDNEDFPTYTLTLYRYDGSSCLAEVDGEPVALVSRNQTVSLIEAVNALTLNYD